MGKPDQPKDIKPKTEGEGAAPKAKVKVDDNMKVIIINLATTILICILFLSITYVMMSSLLNSKLAQKPAVTTEEGADGEAAADSEDGGDSDVQKGFIVDLGDFILNLSDVAPRKYLKVNVAMEVSSKPEDTAPAPKKKEGHGEGGEGGGAAANPLDAEMAQFKPAIRDAVITNLSSKTAAELQTVAGKELAKEQITEAVNGIFAGDREVLRVSFGEFIIQ